MNPPRVVLAFIPEKDAKGEVVNIVAAGLPLDQAFDPRNLPQRNFISLDYLIYAMEPAGMDPAFIRRMRESVQNGVRFDIEVDADQAAKVGLCPISEQ